MEDLQSKTRLGREAPLALKKSPFGEFLIACLLQLQLLVRAKKFINHFLDIAIHKARHIIN